MFLLTRKIQAFALVVFLSLPLMAQAALPEFTEIVEEARDSVVNISTKSRTPTGNTQGYKIPELPEGSPFGELFE
ncbi:MAG: peptidase, partial [Pseudomonadota bacterium]